MNEKYKNIKKDLKLLDVNYLENEPMKKHTTFGIGGPVDLLILPKKNSQLQHIIKLINKDKSFRYKSP